jgi:hypothetical protein
VKQTHYLKVRGGSAFNVLSLETQEVAMKQGQVQTKDVAMELE